ncbi:hypothetical protein HDU97_009773 [Phlyctochytrium planicorne]|nr:hypothetical protein HDU97_009773 [Phlyctochytrium planicorne]
MRLAYNARAQAYMNLGRQRHPDDIKLLLAAASDPVLATAGNVRAGVLRGLGFHRSEEAFKYLLSRLPRGSEVLLAQMAVLMALGDMDKWQLKNEQLSLAERVAEQLLDPRQLIKQAAIGTLTSLETSSYAGSAGNVLSFFPEQEKPRLRKAVKALREAGSRDEKIKTLSASIEDLETNLKKIEQQYQLSEAKLKEDAEKAKEAKEKEAKEKEEKKDEKKDEGTV